METNSLDVVIHQFKGTKDNIISCGYKKRSDYSVHLTLHSAVNVCVMKNPEDYIQKVDSISPSGSNNPVFFIQMLIVCVGQIFPCPVVVLANKLFIPSLVMFPNDLRPILVSFAAAEG